MWDVLRYRWAMARLMTICCTSDVPRRSARPARRKAIAGNAGNLPRARAADPADHRSRARDFLSGDRHLGRVICAHTGRLSALEIIASSFNRLFRDGPQSRAAAIRQHLHRRQFRHAGIELPTAA